MIHWLMNLDMAGGGVPAVRGGGRIRRTRAPLRINGYAEPEPALARFTIYAPEATGSAAARLAELIADSRTFDPRTAVSVYIQGVAAESDVQEVRAAGIHNLQDDELALIASLIGDFVGTGGGTHVTRTRAEDLNEDEELALIIAELWDKWIS